MKTRKAKLQKKHKICKDSVNGVPKQNHKSKKPSREAAVVAQSRSPIVVEVRESEPLSGMRKWLAEYHSKRPGFHVLQQQIDSFIADFEDREEQAWQERESTAAEEGWTVVTHQKGRKKTTDTEGAISVGGVAAAAVDRKRKKQNTDTALNFYRFQRRESRRNEIMELQQRFEEDKKRIAALRAARKFRPY